MSQIENDGDKGNWFSTGDVVYLKSNNESTILNEIRIALDVNRHTNPVFQELDAEMMLLMHLCGGGSERETAILNMYAKQLSVGGTHISYTLVHNKEYSVQSFTKTPAEHKMPMSMIPYFFLHRSIVARINIRPESRCKVFIDFDGNARQFDIITAAAAHFNINHVLIKKGEIRQLGTSITNKVLDKHKQDFSMEATNEGAVMCNHGAGVHLKHYPTLYSDATEIAFNLCHTFLGEISVVGTENQIQQIIQSPISKDTQLRALQMLLGSEASFRNEEQATLVNMLCNPSGKHKFGVLGCGGGKLYQQ